MVRDATSLVTTYNIYRSVTHPTIINVPGSFSPKKNTQLLLVGWASRHWCQLNMKPLSKPDVELNHLPSRSALPHPNPPDVLGRELNFLFPPLTRGD